MCHEFPLTLSLRVRLAPSIKMMKAPLLLALLVFLCGAQSHLSAQDLSDIEISAGYCLGVLDSDLDYLKAAPTTKTVLHYQEIARRRPLTPLEQLDYDSAKSALPVFEHILAERKRVHSYLRAKGLFLPGRTQDFLTLLGSIDRGKADFYGCVNTGRGTTAFQTVLRPIWATRGPLPYVRRVALRPIPAEGGIDAGI
jgi:hypothetical protein